MARWPRAKCASMAIQWRSSSPIDRYGARDARDLIEVDYEPLPVAMDVEKAAQPGAPLLYEEFGTNVALSLVLKDRRKLSTKSLRKHLPMAVLLSKSDSSTNASSPTPIETRGVVADYSKAMKKLTLWSSSQIPHILRNVLAATVGLPQHQVRVIVPEVGGGFGSKLNIYPEEYIAAFASMKLGRPVKWIEDRSESMSSTTHGRDQVNYIEIAATREGKVTGVKIHVFQ